MNNPVLRVAEADGGDREIAATMGCKRACLID
jgi:hypothetical protein